MSEEKTPFQQSLDQWLPLVTDDRQRKFIVRSLDYSLDPYGEPNHLAFLTIATLARWIVAQRMQGKPESALVFPAMLQAVTGVTIQSTEAIVTVIVHRNIAWLAERMSGAGDVNGPFLWMRNYEDAHLQEMPYEGRRIANRDAMEQAWKTLVALIRAAKADGVSALLLLQEMEE